ncbi:MAG: 16S rRNA (cytosine(967)-C(5))-methyltransferase RsmB [Gammaproteobacteria bacterium]|nr:16S rRNA (cytosine(967)-C(5))-methyltransferase RsmB [Gammaproteobacteria bacterium]
MSGAGSRRVSALAVCAVLQGRSYARALNDAGHARLSRERQALASELAQGALRWQHRHREILRRLMDRPRPASRLDALLSVGLFQLSRTRIPAHAAVHACVAAAKELLSPAAARLVNAVLRRYLRERSQLEATADRRLEGRFSHPGWMIRRFQAGWPGHWESILRAGNRKPPLWLRVNRAKLGRHAYRMSLLNATAWSCGLPQGLPDGLRVDPPMPVSRLPGFSDGLVSVQDAGAQLAVPFLGARSGMRVLDACAAPGGKTAQLLETCPGMMELVALDSDAGRLDRLKENLDRLGLEANVCLGDALRPREWWDGRPFDRILLDAPCSATGVIRRHPDIKHLRRAQDIPRFARLQSRLLGSLWPLLKPGGRLLYSVCSVLPDETVRVIESFLRENVALAREVRRSDRVSISDRLSGAWALPLSSHGYQVLPGSRCADGHFNALLEKTAETQA